MAFYSVPYMRVAIRIAVVVCALFFLALHVQPSSVEVTGGPDTSFEQVFTLVNDQPRPVSVTITPHAFSEYLANAVTLSDTSFALRPGESRNLQVRGRVPVLGPETHRLTYRVTENTAQRASFTLEIPVQGTPRLHLGIDVEASDVLRNEPFTATAQLHNFGNVIAYYNLSLHIHQEATPVGTIQYPSLVQVLPGEQQEVALLYTNILEPGEYNVELRATVNHEQEVTATQPFRVLLEDQDLVVTRGDDLVFTLSGTAEAQSITYTVARNGRELYRDALIAVNDTVTVPTSLFEPGRYDITIDVTHPHGTDTTRIALVVREHNLFGMHVLLAVLGMGLISLLFTRTARLHMRITWVSLKLRREEKRLKRLLETPHQPR